MVLQGIIVPSIWGRRDFHCLLLLPSCLVSICGWHGLVHFYTWLVHPPALPQFKSYHRECKRTPSRKIQWKWWWIGKWVRYFNPKYFNMNLFSIFCAWFYSFCGSLLVFVFLFTVPPYRRVGKKYTVKFSSVQNSPHANSPGEINYRIRNS